MAGRDERLTPATRNYVIFGLLLVVALALAAHDRFGPHKGRGESDSALRLLLVGGSTALASALDEVDGFSVTRIEATEAVALGRELLEADTPRYLAAIAHADQRGFGFVALALDTDDPKHDPAAAIWGLDDADPGIEALPPASARFVVFSVGDLAPEGPRMRVAELAPLDYEAPLGELESVRLALYDHPDLQALWEREGAHAQLQARQVLGNRGLLERRAAYGEDQQRWRELSELWPAPGTIAGSLAGAWEQVQAAPIRGGVLLEARPVRATISVFRHPRLELADASELWFVPLAELGTERSDPSRIRCEGLPTTLQGPRSEISIAPDGASLVLRERPSEVAQLYVFDEQAARQGSCLASLAASLPPGEPAIGRTNSARRMAWYDQEDSLQWFVGGALQREAVPDIHAYSGPWWVDDTLLAMIAARPLDPPEQGFDQVVTLLDTGAASLPLDEGGNAPRLELDASALFPGLDPHSGAAALMDLRPVGAHELLLLSERCDEREHEQARPCLHRLRSEAPLVTLTAAPANPEQAPGYALETLGPIGPYLALAIAAEGGRMAWIAADAAGGATLMHADLRGPQALEAHRLDDDALDDATPRISADARVVLSEVSVALGELGSVSIARAFVLPPVPAAMTPPPAPAVNSDPTTPSP